MRISNTYTTKNFSGEIEEVNGKKRIAIHNENFYQTEINRFKVGDKVSINVTNKKPKRTLAQNRRYWWYLEMICQETGEPSAERLHALFSGKFLTVGMYKVLGETVRMKRSTTDLTVSEMIEYIMKIEAETGIIPPPLDDDNDYVVKR